MTATPDQGSTLPSDAVSVDFQAIVEGYQAELAEQVQRRIMAEASAAALRKEREELRQTIHALSPGAPTVQEN